MNQPPYTNFGPLDFVFSEFNHDFGKKNGLVLATDLHNFYEMFRGYFGAACIVDGTDPDNVSLHTDPVVNMDDNLWRQWYAETTLFFETNTKLNDEALVKQIFNGNSKHMLGELTYDDTVQTNGDYFDVFIKCLFSDTDARQHWTRACPAGEVGSGFGFADQFLGGVTLPQNLTSNPNFRYYLNNWVRGTFRCYQPDQVDAGLVRHAFNGLNDIYIVSDAASQCARTIWESALNGINVHCMYSSSTYGDPSSDANPWDPTHNTAPVNSTVYDWICRRPLSKSSDNSMTLMKVTINHTSPTPGAQLPATQAGSRVIRKTIERDPPLPPPTPPQIGPLDYADAAAETSKPLANLIVANEPQNPGATTHLRKLWKAQGKRFGDHEQVIFAKMLQYRNWVVHNDWYVRATPPTPNPLPLHPNSTAANTFLATGDWPCFCYAVYNRINAIMIVNHQWYVFRFT